MKKNTVILLLLILALVLVAVFSIEKDEQPNTPEVAETTYSGNGIIKAVSPKQLTLDVAVGIVDGDPTKIRYEEKIVKFDPSTFKIEKRVVNKDSFTLQSVGSSSLKSGMQVSFIADRNFSQSSEFFVTSMEIIK